jgi:hypothetical protein
MDIIETDEYRELLKTELEIFKWADDLAKMNRRYMVKCSTIVVKNAQIICGNLASFRASMYTKESQFHPENTILDMYSADINNLSMYVVKMNLEGEPLPSRPCVQCMRAIKSTDEIVNLFYRDDRLRMIKEVIE